MRFSGAAGASASLRRRIVAGWRDLVGIVEDGYTMTIDDYTNDLAIRDVVEEVRPFLTEAVRELLDEDLAPLDQRYESATRAASGRLPGGSTHWWAQRVPKVLVGELAETSRGWGCSRSDMPVGHAGAQLAASGLVGRDGSRLPDRRREPAIGALVPTVPPW